MIQPPSVGPMVGAMMAVIPYSANAKPRFCGRERVRQNGLRHGLKPAAADALDHAEQNQHPQAGSDAAQQRAEGEQ